MNRFFRICFLCVAGVVVFLLGMWFASYLDYQKVMDEQSPIRTEDEIASVQLPEEPSMVEATIIPTIDMNTQYIIIKENTITGEIEETTEELPSRMVGMSRTEVEEFWEDYAKCPVLHDREEGFVSAFVESYSPEKLVVKKIYEPIHLAEKFYLKAEENYVVVYYGDNSTVYMYTNIRMDSLPEETRQEIENCKEIETYESLYSFLESHTS